MDVRETVHGLGGFAQKQQLVRLGATDRALTVAVRSGEVIRVRNGWYSTVPESDARLLAIRVGGRLTGLSAIWQLGGWVLSAPVLHVAVPPNAARLRTPRDRRQPFDVLRPGAVVVHWEPREQLRLGSSGVVGLLDALYRVVLDEKLETVVAALDWALHTGQIDEFDLDLLMRRIPPDLRWVEGWIDPKSESLPESLSRTRFRLSGHSVEIQVPIPSDERIDIVVDGCAAFEVDGKEYHADSFLRDRAKDLRITIAGFHAMRAAASMVFRDWDEVYLAVTTALVARGVVLPDAVGNSGKGRYGPRSRAEFARGRRPAHE